VGINKATTIEGLKGFDVDLSFGKHFEHLMDDILSGKYTDEVKTERDQRVSYGNITIELECNKKPSGITKTTSDQWIQNIRYKGELQVSFIMYDSALLELNNAMNIE